MVAIRSWLGEDGKYHRRRSNYSDFTDYSTCSRQSAMVRVGGVPKDPVTVNQELRCQKCLKEKLDERDGNT